MVTFEKTLYVQIAGLAMEIACSPDLVNSYAAEHEEEYDVDKLLLFQHYIDDMFMITEADNEEDALRIAQRITYPNLEVEWEASRSSLKFLDVLVSLDGMGRIDSRLYKKPLNHHQL